MNGADRCQVDPIEALKQIQQNRQGLWCLTPALDQRCQGGISQTTGLTGDAVGQGGGGLLEPHSDAPADFRGGGTGEGHHQDRVDGAALLSHLAQHAMAERIGLSGAGTGLKHEGAALQRAVEIQRADHGVKPPAARASLRGSSTRSLSSHTSGCCSQRSRSGDSPASSCSRASGQR